MIPIEPDSNTQGVLRWLTFEQPETQGLPQVGDLIEGHRLESELGCGGGGVVYLAHHIELDRKVAVKVVPISQASEEQAERYRVEARLLARLRHPNIVEVYDAGVQSTYRWFAMEWVDGLSLNDYLARPDNARTGRGFIHRAAELLEEIALALNAAHEGDVVHGDLKPSNVLVDRDGSARVIDFGLARHNENRVDSNGSSDRIAFQGTPAFAAPEHRQRGARTKHSDIYSFGMVATVVLTGGLNPDELKAQRVPHDLRQIVRKCLEERPSRRYATAHDLARDLRRFTQHEPVSVAPRNSASRLWMLARRRPLWSAAILLLLVATTASGALWERLQELGDEVTNREVLDNLTLARDAFHRGDFFEINALANEANAQLKEELEWQQLVADSLLAQAEYVAAGRKYEQLQTVDSSQATQLGARIAQWMAGSQGNRSAQQESFSVPAIDQPNFRDCFMRVIAYQRVFRQSNQSLIAWSEQALAARPTGNATVLRAHTTTLASTGRRGEAIELLELAIRLSPDNKRAREARCSLLTAAARFTEAEQEILSAIKRFGPKARWIKRRVDLHTTTGNLAVLRESTLLLDKLVTEQGSSDLGQLVTLTMANARLGNHALAELWLTRCSQFKPSKELSKRASRALRLDQALVEADVKRELQLWEQARIAYQEADDPNFPRLQFSARLGLAYCDYYLSGPVAALDQVLPLCEHGFGNVAAVGWALECGRVELARELAGDALARDPDNARLQALASMVQLANDDQSESFRLASRAQQINPDHFGTRNWLAYVYANCGWPNKALGLSSPRDAAHYWDEHEAVLRVATLLVAGQQEQAHSEFKRYQQAFATQRLTGACHRLPNCPPTLIEWIQTSS